MTVPGPEGMRTLQGSTKYNIKQSGQCNTTAQGLRLLALQPVVVRSEENTPAGVRTTCNSGSSAWVMPTHRLLAPGHNS